jgi:predicted permease
MTQVQEDMDSVGRTMIEQYASYPYQRFGFGVILHPLLEETVGDVRPVLFVLMAAVGLVLLIACANVANLLLARATERQQEMETRLALGASGERLARQMLTESVVLAFAGGALGLAITPAMLQGLLALAAKTLPRAVNTGVDLRVLGLTAVVSVATGILFGLAPAVQVRHKLHFDAVKAGKNTEGRRPKQLRNGLVIFETALSLVLVAGAGLLLRSFAQITKVDAGFKPEGVLTMHVALREAVYSKPEQVRAFYDTLLNRVQGLPGVQAAGAVNNLPLSGKNSSGTITVDTQAVPQEKTSPEADGRVVTPGYFKAMGIALTRGRTFEAGDTEGAPPVAIVDESLAQTYWPNEDPIGRRLHTGGRGSNQSWLTVVGVVRPVRNRTLETRSRVEVYLPQDQEPQSDMTLAIRTKVPPMSVAPTVEREVSVIDPTLPVFRVRTMSEVMGDSLQRRRLGLELLGVFAELALLLALIGIYGVTSYTVTQRQVEVGLRMALGANRWDVLRMMVRSGMETIAIGLGVGLVLALGLTRLMRGMLFDVQAWDPLALGGATLLLVLMALLAILIPARRATTVDPMTALRHE